MVALVEVAAGIGRYGGAVGFAAQFHSVGHRRRNKANDALSLWVVLFPRLRIRENENCIVSTADGAVLTAGRDAQPCGGGTFGCTPWC
jgi:hypothetical protein